MIILKADYHPLAKVDLRFSGFVDASLAIADVNGDGSNEVIATSFSHGWSPWDGQWGRVYILSPENGGIVTQNNFYKPVWLGGLAALDKDGLHEIIVCQKAT